MTGYQLYTRLRHAVTARHWRGHGIHSPMMYRFVRETVLPCSRRELPEVIAARYGGVSVGSFEELAARSDSGSGVVMWRAPFRSARERRAFERWFAETHVVAAHLQGLLVLFFDPKLQKQFFRIRN